MWCPKPGTASGRREGLDQSDGAAVGLVCLHASLIEQKEGDSMMAARLMCGLMRSNCRSSLQHTGCNIQPECDGAQSFVACPKR